MIIEIKVERQRREQARKIAKEMKIPVEELDSAIYAIGLTNLAAIRDLSAGGFHGKESDS